MFKHSLIFVCLISSSMAVSIDAIVKNTFAHNHTLKSIEESIGVTIQSIALSGKWKNPTLNLGINDIQFDDVSQRDLEPMQAQYIGFSQVIPMGDKLKLQEEMAYKDNSISKYALKDKRKQLKAKIYEYAYEAKILEKKHELLTQYQKNIKTLEELVNISYENGQLSQVDVFNVKIAYSNLELKKEELKNTIDNIYLKLEEISNIPIRSIEASTSIKAIPLVQDINTHPKIVMIEQTHQKFNTLSKLENARKNSDIKLNMAYFNRDSKYEDYANVSVNIPLSVYSTENIKSVQAKIRAREISEKRLEMKLQFQTSIKTLKNSISSSIKKYKLLRENILPLKKKIQTNLERYNSLNQSQPQESIKSLNEIILYELKSLDELSQYHRLVSKLRYFSKENTNEE